jgi:HAD superfamily hydrolase (TIGR01490 family)
MGEGAFFDLDKTIIAKSAMLAYGGSFYREGLLSRKLIMRGMYSQFVFMLFGADEDRMERMREQTLVLIRGWSQQHLADIVREGLDEIVTPIIFAEALELMDQHRAAGRRVVIVSSSPVELVAPLSEMLGTDYIATVAKVDSAGRYTGELEFYSYGPHKADAIHAYAAEHDIDLAASYAYSDSITDLPMLETVGHPVAVNADRELAAIARERGWELRNFTRPVRLRDRLPPEHALPILAIAAVAALTVGVVMWWAKRSDES